MKASELRIGNLVKRFRGISDEGPEYQILRINAEFFMSTVLDNLNDIEPIEVTEEWLLKFYFEKKGDFWYIKNGIKIESTQKGFVYYRYSSAVVIKSVHQLQNLYFALCGEELELK